MKWLQQKYEIAKFNYGLCTSLNDTVTLREWKQNDRLKVSGMVFTGVDEEDLDKWEENYAGKRNCWSRLGKYAKNKN